MRAIVRAAGAALLAAALVATARESDTTKIIPGHGPLSGKAELKAYRDARRWHETRGDHGIRELVAMNIIRNR